MCIDKENSEFKYQINDEQITITCWKQYYSEEVIIPESIEGFPVTRIGAEAFKSCEPIKVILPGTILEIGERAFSPCRIEAIRFSKGLKVIGKEAFNGCIYLTDLVFPESLETIEEEAFSNCVNLKSVTFPENMLKIGTCAFSECKNLSTITLPNHVCFVGERTFLHCELLDNITLPHNIENGADRMFLGCHNLQIVNIPYGIKSIPRQMFSDCIHIKEISIPESVKYIGKDAFWGCSSLRKIVLPNSNMQIDSCAFARCESISDIYIPKNVIIYPCINPFPGCKNLKSIQVSCDHQTLLVVDNVLFDKTGETLICYPAYLPSKEYNIPFGTKSICQFAFSDCVYLEKVNIPETVKWFSDGDFSDCNKLKKFCLPNGSKITIGENEYPLWEGLEEKYVYERSYDSPIEFSNIDRSTIIGEVLNNKEIRAAYEIAKMNIETLRKLSYIGYSNETYEYPLRLFIVYVKCSCKYIKVNGVKFFDFVFEDLDEYVKQNSNKVESIDKTYEMSAFDFEELIVELFSRMGYKAESTKKSGDQGVDVIARKGCVTIAIQTKNYPHTIVGNKAVQEVVAGMAYYKASNAMVITNSSFTKSAIELAKANNVVLWDKTTLGEKLAEYMKPIL